MATVATAISLHRHIIPFALALRLISLTSAPSLAIAADLPAALPDRSFATVQLKENSFLTATNQARALAGLPALSLNAQLEEAAMAKAVDMAEKGYWDHYRPSDQKAPWDFIKENGYQYKVAGENLARGFSTVEGITNAWLASPTHRANVLSTKYTEVGFASVESVDPVTGRTVLLTVQMFGSR